MTHPRHPPPTTHHPAEAGGPALELSPTLRRDLLDPAAWQEGLEQFARAMHLAVVLVDADGRQLGPCLNPQPLWDLLHSHQPAEPGECPFAVKVSRPCTCFADALRTRAIVRTRGRTGLVHFAVPLLLDGVGLGALIAGQVFDQYPDQLPLEQVAMVLGIAPGQVWEKARREHPVNPATLQVYAGLLGTLGRTFLQGRYHALLETARLQQLRQAEQALRQANDELERRVEERTAALRQAQHQALQAERLAALGQMVAGLAHEGRNALQRIQGGLTRLGYRLQDQPEALGLLDNVQKAQDDLHRLFEEVRAYAGPLQLELRLCNLEEVWREAWADLGPTCERRHAELRETAAADPRCVASAFHLKQVFRNLFDNALSMAQDPVWIAIGCADAEVAGQAGVRVSVCDNGPGFADLVRPQAFEPFFTTKPRGTGLGLAICKRIVEAHGGTIELGNQACPGAEVVITLPRRPP